MQKHQLQPSSTALWETALSTASSRFLSEFQEMENKPNGPCSLVADS